LRSNLERLGVMNVRLLALDAQQPLPFSGAFDRILVDAPCSGTGTLARNPEIRWRLRPGDLPELAARQAAILRHALEVLAPAGRLVYATCSLEPEENEQVVEQVLATAPGIRLISGREALLPHLREGAEAGTLFDAQGYFRTFPHVHGTDGFFAAVMECAPR
jgi:16S rRNA (cytosine967-C5)-methyltransferase